MPPRQHLLDDVASDIADWIESMSDAIAGAFTEGGVAPFAANVSEQQKLAYFESMVYLPDGSINVAGRNTLMQTYGADGYAQIMRRVLSSMGGLPPIPPLGPTSMMSAIPRAAGGPVDPNDTYLVGENAPELYMAPDAAAVVGAGGPEVFVPPEAGVVVPPYTPVQPVAAPTPVAQATDWQLQPPATQSLFQNTVGVGNASQEWTSENNARMAYALPQEVEDYIRQAAQARGIDPDVALAVARHEGANPETGQFNNTAERGTFATGSSWWPFQLHYGGKGYEQLGTTAGLGNDFTAQTGWQPGDPRAWRDSVDFALDVALNRGWYPTFYGSVPAGVKPRQGLPDKRG